jgi:ferric-dicitrate binding protein FerR (iron transport regulator)
MAKQATARKVEVTAQPAETAVPAATPATPVGVVKVKAGMKYRGARQAWYERIVSFDGKPLADLVANVEKNRPSVYGNKSRNMGQPEPVSGWLQFFKRTGVMKIENT